jgi:hypothetical protein
MGDMWLNLVDARETAQAWRAKQEVVWANKGPDTIEDGAKLVRQSPLCWDKRGAVMKCEGFDQYQVMIDGSRRLTEGTWDCSLLFTLTCLWITIKHAVLLPWMEQWSPPSPSLPASSSPPGVYLVMCSATKNVARGRDKTRFPSIGISNIRQGFNVKNIEVMSTNLYKIVQHREQWVTSWSGQSQQLKIIVNMDMRDKGVKTARLLP